ncbi:DUF1684 domain-containing protein [Algoriphagus sp.]
MERVRNISNNTPCEFPAFATCPIPSKENRLIVAIRSKKKISTKK